MKIYIYQIIGLLVIVVFACKPYETEEFKHGGKPSGSFTYTPDQDTGYIIDFTAQSENGGLYTWLFGDITKQYTTSKTVRHAYLAKGTYQVSLVINGPNGIDTVTQPVEVKQDDPTICDNENFILLTGGCDDSDGKTWVFDRGQNAMWMMDANYEVWWWGSPVDNFLTKNPNQSCIHDEEYTFLMNAFEYKRTNSGKALFNWEYANEIYGLNQPQYGDTCCDYPSTTATWALSYDNKGELVLNFTDKEWMAYYEGVSSYFVVKLNQDTLEIKNKIDGGWRHMIFLEKNHFNTIY